ncbi:MAG TPA: hypothetical protein VEY51_20385 [Chondromyces sp.]|nr:hypothetical protein [Chondromyces sp.]
MGKKKWDKRGNVVIFPGTKEVLVQKGREALEQKKFEEAASFFSQSLELSPETDEEDIQTALLLSLYEGGRYEEAMQLGKKMLHEGTGEYFDVLDIYVLILIQLKRYEEIESTLTALLEEHPISEEKREHFERLLQFSRKMKHPTIEKNKKLFLGDETFQEKTFKLAELIHANIQPYLPDLLALLSNAEVHPFLQTLALNVLKEHGYDKPVNVQKFSFQMDIIPAALEDVFSTPYFISVLETIERELGQSNPTLLEHVTEMVKRHFFLLFPFEPEQFSPETWTKASILLAENYYGAEQEDGHVTPELRHCLAIIRELDEISSPIL